MIKNNKKTQWQRYFERRNRPAWAMLALCLGVMTLVWYSARGNQETNAQQQFILHVNDIVQAIDGRLRQHEQILLGGAGLFDASRVVDRKEWRAYVERLNLAKNYPGILGVGYSVILQPSELAAHEASVRSEGFRDFSVKPAGERPLYSSIIFLEPFSGRNLAAFGYDMLSESTRAKAMKLAGETATTAISGKVRLVQETHGKVQAGFLMYVPIYRKNQPLNSAAQRWKALRGFVYSPYRADDLMNGIMGERIPDLDFTIFDGKGESDEALMYSTMEEYPTVSAEEYRPHYSAQRTINAYGHTWTLRLQSRPKFDAQFQSQAGVAALLLGGSTSVLLFVLVSTLIFRREQAEELANSMTAKIRLNEEILRESEERFELAVRASNDGIWDWNIDTGEFYYSPRFKELLGLEDKDLAANFNVFEESLHQEDKSATQAALRSHLLENKSIDVTCRMKTYNGEWRWFRICGVAERATDGRAVRMVGSILDITERKVAERTLRESHAHTQTILDNMIDGIITIDGTGIIQSVNHAGEKIFGYEAPELIGKNVYVLIPEPFRSRHDSYLKNYRNTGISKIIGVGREMEGVRRDGSVFPMDLAVSKITHQGRPLFIGMVRDITERKKYDRMKSEFVSTVSHELRTPLTSIKGALSLVLSKSADELSPKVRTMLQTANRNSERLTLLINDILDLEKIQSGRLQFEFRPLDIVKLAQQALVVNESYAIQHSVHMYLKTTISRAIVWGDEHRLQQVFANLLSNAIKFSPTEGTVNITVSQHGKAFRVSIRDHGRGIPQAFRERVFQRFAQADSSDTREKGGTGLGLSITKAIIERLDGVIDYKSVEGEGSEFYFDLPEWQEVIETEGVDDSSNKILICEDDQDMANVLAGMLAQDGLVADIVGTVRAAREMITHKSYCLMMLDIGLPDGDGVELIQELAKEQTIRGLPVIVVTGQPLMAQTKNSAAYSSIVDWLQKPVERTSLSKALHKAGIFTARPRILYVGGDSSTISLIQPLIEQVGQYRQTSDLDNAKAQLEKETFDLVLLDVPRPGEKEIKLISEIRAMCPKVLFTDSELAQDTGGNFSDLAGFSLASQNILLERIKQSVKKAS